MAAKPDHVHQQLARELGGVFHPRVWLSDARLEFTLAGRAARLTWADPDGRDPSSILDIDLRGRSPGILKIHPEGFGSSIARMFGEQDIEVGDRRFDALYVVKARPSALALEVFREDRLERVIASVRRLGKYSSMRIDLSRERLRVGVGESVSDEAGIRKILLTAEEFVGYLRDIDLSSGIEWQAAREEAPGPCPVCASRLKAPLSRCRRCRTPHHRECWDYAGGCSTYACGGRDTT